MKHVVFIWIHICCVLSPQFFVECGKVLILPLHYSASHKKSMIPLATAIADRGHNVTVFNVVFAKVPIKGDHRLNDQDLVITTKNRHYNELLVWHNGTDILNGWNAPELKPWDEVYEWYLNIDMCKHALDQYPDKFKGVIEDSWDFLIIDTLMAPCGMLIVHKSRAPYMLFSTTYALPATLRHLGIPQPIDGLPISEVHYNFKKFWHRVKHTFIWHIYDLFHYRLLQWMHKWFLWPDFPVDLDFKQFDQESLLNFHSFSVTLDDPKPTTLDNIALGDPPCLKVDPAMPEDYEKFVGNPDSKGTIIAAFGHNVDWRLASNDSILAFYFAFQNLTKYQVIWQYNGPNIFDKSKLGNVKVTKWLPQSNLLHHNRTKLFISHMGLKSSFEGLCAKVPFLAMPVYAEQPLNARIITGKQKLGKSISKFKLSADEIIEKSRAIMNDQAFNDRIGKIAEIAQDKIEDPLKIGAFWADYAIRHKGNLGIMKIRARNLNHFVYNGADIIVFVILILIILVKIIVYIVYHLVV